MPPRYSASVVVPLRYLMPAGQSEATPCDPGASVASAKLPPEVMPPFRPLPLRGGHAGGLQ